MRTLSQWARLLSPRTRRTIAIALLGFSAFSTLLGMRALTSFDQTAGAAGATPARWPGWSGIKRSGGRPELLVFVHPFCSCTAATMAEIEQLSARRKPGAAAPAITFLFFRPSNSGWGPNGLWRKAQDLENARAVWDDGAREAKRFGARTSGYVLLYSAEGDLLFRGGITGSRGHQGDNYGLDQLVTSLDSGRSAGAPSRVFGCALGGLDEETDGAQ